MGFVKNSSPPRFIDEKLVVDAIKQVASQRLQALSENRMFRASTPDMQTEFLLLSQAATLVSGHKKTDAGAVAQALLEPAALELIQRKCLNPYWFWYLLEKLQPAAFPLDAACLARAHARAKDSLYDNRHGFAFVSSNCLEHQLKQLPPGFVFELWHKGRLIADRVDSGEYPIHLNPLLLED